MHWKQECIRSKAQHQLQDRNPNNSICFWKDLDLKMTWTSKQPWPWYYIDVDGHINIISWFWKKKLVSNSQNSQFYKSDLDLDSMTLVLKIDLNIVKMYHHTKNEVSMSWHSKVIACTDGHTQAVWKHYLPAYAGWNILYQFYFVIGVRSILWYVCGKSTAFEKNKNKKTLT